MAADRHISKQQLFKGGCMSTDLSKFIRNKALLDKVITAEEAATWIEDGMTLGMSGFTLFGEPKVFPSALAKHASANNIKVNVYTGASMGPDADGVLAEHKAINLRLPYQGNPTLRKEINTPIIINQGLV